MDRVTSESPPRRSCLETFQEAGFDRDGAPSGGRTPWVQPQYAAPHRLHRPGGVGLMRGLHLHR